MPSRAIKPERDDTMLSGFESRPEEAPSIVKEGEASIARVLALVGLVLFAVGLFAVLAPAFGKAYIIGPGTGVFALSLGLFLLIYHAVTDQDVQYRLLYLSAGYLAIAGGVLLRVLPLNGKVGGLFLPVGVPGMVLGLIFVLTAIRHETEGRMRFNLSLPIGVLGFFMVIIGSFAGHISTQYLLVEGVLMSLVGLVFISAFIGVQGFASENGFRTGVALGLVGVVALAAALLRSFFNSTPFFIPSGLILVSISLVYIALAAMICTDLKVLVIFRRDLKSFFLSPIGFLVLLGNVLIAWIWFYFFQRNVQEGSQPEFGGLPEPIVSYYLFNPVLVLALSFIVPVLTMRLLSDEKKSGTLEVLLTAPLSEMSLVLGKFFAALALYLCCWLPWLGFLVALRLYTGTEFEFRPLLSFLPVLVVTGMAFLALGIFFSSVTSNQIIAAVLTFVAMMLQWLPHILKSSPRFLKLAEDSPWHEVLTFVSPLDLWLTSLFGILAPRYFCYFISLTVFFLFLTTKVLEARKWK
jgi:ABC-2 type transport system permease protein